MRPVSVLLTALLLGAALSAGAQADPTRYLSGLREELGLAWPKNRTINLVFHGHSVPTGYARTPTVRRTQAYPFLLLDSLEQRYPHAVVNIITTSIGGENSEQGARRFARDVLPLHPDLIFIDYALNDRGIGLERARKATEQMIRQALERHIPVILLTPSPDLGVDIAREPNVLGRFSAQLRALAAQYHIGLADSYAAFRRLALDGEDLHAYMAQSNHPNARGHQVIVREILKWFE